MPCEAFTRGAISTLLFSGIEIVIFVTIILTTLCMTRIERLNNFWTATALQLLNTISSLFTLLGKGLDIGIVHPLRRISRNVRLNKTYNPTFPA